MHKHFSGLLMALALSATSALPSPPALAADAPDGGKLPLPAFPGAEGFGSRTPGGRGGEVYIVTNLDDSGPGSLRDAVSKPRRTIVFAVSGTIDLKRNLIIEQPYLTIAGQTAPGEGICLRNYTVAVQSTHDVIIRFLRCRLGDTQKQQSDAFDVNNGCHDVIIDHVSATWSVDECLSTAGDDQNITIQWCLIAEGLNHSVHTKGDHGFGSLARANGPVSWLHNLWAHNNSRNPRLGDRYNNGPHPQFDVRNNVIYDYGASASGLTQGFWNANYVGNYIKPGPSSKAKTPISTDPNSTIGFHLAGNVFEGHDEFTRDNRKFPNAIEAEGKPFVTFSDKPFADPFPLVPVNTMSAEDAYKAALAAVGACLPARDKVDARIISEVRTGTGRIIDSQNDVGGWPELKSAPAPLDTDKDGMPDAWETTHGLNPNDPADRNTDADKDGYTALEEYLNNTDPKTFVDYRDPKNNVDALIAPLLKAAK
jgi:pectate lyase